MLDINNVNNYEYNINGIVLVLLTKHCDFMIPVD